MGKLGRPPVLSSQSPPLLSERYTRPPPTEEYVAHMRDGLWASTNRSLTTAPARGVVSAVGAVQPAPFHCVCSTRPSVRPTNTVSTSEMYIALARPPPGYVIRAQAVPLFRDT